MIRLLNEQDFNAYKELRLELLQKEPRSFGSSFEEESNMDDSFWMKRLSNPNIKVYGYFDQELIGICLLVYNPRRKLSHVASIHSMYVKEEYRGNKIAQKLLSLIIADAKISNLEIVRLSVANWNEVAIKLYKKLGFKPYAFEENAIKLEDEYIDIIHMSNIL